MLQTAGPWVGVQAAQQVGSLLVAVLVAPYWPEDKFAVIFGRQTCLDRQQMGQHAVGRVSELAVRPRILHLIPDSRIPRRCQS